MNVRGGKAAKALRLARRQEGGEAPDAPPASPPQNLLDPEDNPLSATQKWAPPPDPTVHQEPAAPQPYMSPNVPVAAGYASELNPFGGQGIQGMLNRANVQTPDWSQTLGRTLTSEPAQTALGMANPIRTFGIPSSAEPIISSFRNAEDLKASPYYEAAKGGDPSAAHQFVSSVIHPDTVASAGQRFGPDVSYVPVHAEEAAGRNAIPYAVANYYAASTGANVADDIIQNSREFHTGARPMERLISRPSFSGPVQPGRRYVLVDDVNMMGNTIGELSHHIQSNGGHVAGVVTLANAGRTDNIVPQAARTRLLEKNLGPAVEQELGIRPGALTAAETEYLLGFKNADQLRGSISAATRARDERLLSKGVRPSSSEDLTPKYRGGGLPRARGGRMMAKQALRLARRSD